MNHLEEVNLVKANGIYDDETFAIKVDRKGEVRWFVDASVYRERIIRYLETLQQYNDINDNNMKSDNKDGGWINFAETVELIRNMTLEVKK